MSKQTEIEDNNDDVVVIEERDKRTYLYIAIAGVLGLALGGLGGSAWTAGKWESTYNEIEDKYQALVDEKKQLAVQVEERVANVNDEVAQKLELKLQEQQALHEEQLTTIKAQVSELEKVNLALEEQINQQKEQMAQVDKRNTQLNRQADMQATMFERSRELFQKELKVKMELEALQKEREELQPKLKALKKDCDAYLEGTSWDAKSDACDNQDKVNSRLSQINQMISVYKMDLEQMKALSEELGL